jgi:hypothetical protein
LETNNLENILKQTLSEEFVPAAALDKSTQLKMQRVVERKQSTLVISLSIISLIILTIILILFLSQIPIALLKIIFMMLNSNLFALFVFFIIINNKNRKEAIL